MNSSSFIPRSYSHARELKQCPPYVPSPTVYNSHDRLTRPREGRSLSQTIEETLRQAILRSGWSVNSVAKRAGVPQPAVHVFVHGGGLNIRTADKLARVLGLRLAYDPAESSR